MITHLLGVPSIESIVQASLVVSYFSTVLGLGLSAVHSGTQRYTAVHSGTQRYTAVHSGTQRYTAVHSRKPLFI